MSWKPTIIATTLAIIAVLAALYTYRSDSHADIARGELTMVPLVTAEQLPIDLVSRITVTRAGQPPMVFNRTGLDWMQVEPFAFPMDAYSMRQMSAVAHQVQVVQRLGKDELAGSLTEQALGLNPPEAEIIYEWEGESPGRLKLHLGRRGIAGRAYLRMNDDDQVLIVRQSLHERVVEMDPREWRDRAIFTNVSVQDDRIERSDGLVLVRDRRQWRMLEPVNTRVSPESIEQYFQALGGARSAGFIADMPKDLHRFGLPSAAEVAITSSRGDEQITQRLQIGMPVGAGTQDRFGIVDGRPTVVRIPATVLHALFRPIQSFIDLTGSGVVPADVRSVRISGPAGELTLQRDLERWRAPDHDDIEVPAAYVNELLTQLSQLQASNVMIEEYPQEMEVAVVTFFGFRGQPLDTVRVVRDPDSGVWALENGDNVLRIFPAGFQLRLSPADYGLPAHDGP